MNYARVDTLNEYQRQAGEFARYDTSVALPYNALKLASEAGEVAGKIGKLIGHGKAVSESDIVDELGDVLWHLSMMARDLGFSLADVANRNLTKLEGRSGRGTIVGNGDKR